jgi:glycosyltransferase involved in cell wall biosynthesis
MLVVSREDADYLKEHFSDKKVNYLPSFHANNTVESLTGSGDYALYNGNIEVPENAHAVQWLISEVFAGTDIKLKVAGMSPPDHIRKLAAGHTNVEIIANPDDDEMFSLIKNAHVNILVTFQATGLKLKLLNTLYQGRFCLVNDKMLNGTGLGELCETGNTPAELKQKLQELFKIEFEKKDIDLRDKILNRNFSNDHNAEKLISLVFGDN